MYVYIFLALLFCFPHIMFSFLQLSRVMFYFILAHLNDRTGNSVLIPFMFFVIPDLIILKKALSEVTVVIQSW